MKFLLTCTVLLTCLCHPSLCCKYSTFKNVSARVSVNRRNPQVIIINDCIKPRTETENITDVVISNVNVPVLFEESVIDLKNLKQLTIEKAQIKRVQVGAFNNLKQLKYLSLRNNLVDEIQTSTFNDIALTSLFLEGNEIQKIEHNAFALDNLRILELSNNKLTSFDPKWFGNSNLTHLYLDGNAITEIPANAFKNLSGLTAVSFRKNRISTIYNSAFEGASKLKEINLSLNRLKTVSVEAFAPLRKTLNNFYIGANNLTYLPGNFLDTFENLRNLAIEINPMQCACYLQIRHAADKRRIHIQTQIDTKGRFPVCVESLDNSKVCREAVNEEIIENYSELFKDALGGIINLRA